jgi:dTDP-D-glucose 4,6-dehydratase
MILVTGGAGFIGANFVLDWLSHSSEPVLNLDALTYAGNRENLRSLDGDAAQPRGMTFSVRVTVRIFSMMPSHVALPWPTPARLLPDESTTLKV